MDKYKIRLNSTESVNSVNKDNLVDVEIKQSTKPYLFTENIRDLIDQHEVFENERNNCTKYRLITTIKPYCTNILFNPLTEIVYKEGSNDDAEIVTDIKTATHCKKAFGKTSPNRLDMIRNTEYSSEKLTDEGGYEYHPGTDIFNNHILRNTSFKIVNSYTNSSDRNKFNTIEDVLRKFDGTYIKFTNRTNIDTFTGTINKHLYDYDNIMDIDDTINTNLVEENGWFGFVNKSTILSKKKDGNKWIDNDFNHVINNKESCEFIDMYPDRTLFSFNPKYNKYQHRPEYNWDLCLTYPYKNYYNHCLVTGNNGHNSLLIKNVKFTISNNGQRILAFQCYTKHNLKSGHFINLYFKNNEENDYKLFENIRINNIGDINRKNEEYCFHITNIDVLNQIVGENVDIYDDNVFDDVNENLKNIEFRFNHLINDTESEYYIRIFRKLPNFKNSKEELTLKDGICVDSYDEFIEKNDNNEFDKEQYKLAFSSTIYNDNNTQITWTDGINIDNILDNRGRPLTEIYLTIIKNNDGHDEWYKNKPQEKSVRYSHCFNKLSCGFDLFLSEDERKTFDIEKDFKKQATKSDVKFIHECDFGGNTKYISDRKQTKQFGWGDLDKTEYSFSVDNITILDNEFVGDIVEYNITTCNEYILEDCDFRFNTYLRENGNTLSSEYNYQYDMIETDDYDRDGFKVVPVTNKEPLDLLHPEGYYYKAHYKILLKEFGELHQDSHVNLNIREVNVKSTDSGQQLLVITTRLPHRLLSDEKILVSDDRNNNYTMVNVVSVIDKYNFAIGSIGNLTVQNLRDILSGKYESIEFKLRRYNKNIPFYADKFDNINRYMWRDINTVGNKDNITLPEYAFANGYFYINQDIDFFLKRQDPFNEFGLYYNGENSLPNDVFGNTLPESNYEYKEENEATC